MGQNSYLQIPESDSRELVREAMSRERVRTFDIGTDLGFLNNELKLSFDWYQRRTLGLIVPSATLSERDGTALYTDSGMLRTCGWELSLEWEHRFGDFGVYAEASVWDFKSRVTGLNAVKARLDSVYEGMTYGDIWGFETERWFTPEDFTGFDRNGNPTGYRGGVADQTGIQTGSFIYGPGDVKYRDLNGDGKIDAGDGTQENHGDLKVIGNSQPRYQYGFRLGADWKGLDVCVFFQGVGKRDIWTKSAFVMPFFRGADTIYLNQTDYWDGSFDPVPGTWTVTNADSEYPRLYGGNNGNGLPGIDAGDKNFYPQTRWISRMAYLRLKNFTVGYTLPQKWTRKVRLEKARIYFSGENLLEIIDNVNGAFDPEINDGDGNLNNGVFGRTDPICRTISFGIQLTM